MVNIEFYDSSNDKTAVGKLKYYYNGTYYVDVTINGTIYTTHVSESQLYLEPNAITNDFTVGSTNRHNLSQYSKFELAEAFADGYNNAIMEYDWSEEDVAKIYFGE